MMLMMTATIHRQGLYVTSVNPFRSSVSVETWDYARVTVGKVRLTSLFMLYMGQGCVAVTQP